LKKLKQFIKFIT